MYSNAAPPTPTPLWSARYLSLLRAISRLFCSSAAGLQYAAPRQMRGRSGVALLAIDVKRVRFQGPENLPLGVLPANAGLNNPVGPRTP